MKRTILFISFLITTYISFGQDIIYKTNKDSIVGKVTEIGLAEIKYLPIDNLDGPVYVLPKSSVSRIKFKNGKEEFFLPDEMAVNKEIRVIDKKQTVKVGLFSPTNSHLELSYEKVLNVGTNLSIAAGFINYQINLLQSSYNYEKGGYLQAGIKFLMGQDVYIEGMKYTHPLRGNYIKFEGSFSYFNDKSKSSYYQSGVGYVTNEVKYDSYSFAVCCILGKQLILGNQLIFDIYGGAGFGWKSTDSYTPAPNHYYNNERNYINYFSHKFIDSRGAVCITGGVSLGIIF